MDRDRALEVVEREAGRLLLLLEETTDVGAPVPTCPGWTLDQLATHLGRVYAMVAVVLEGDPASGPDRELVPSRCEEETPARWLRRRLEILLRLLRNFPDEGRAWNFVDGPASPVSFWWRRQAHETLIHRVDAELATGRPVTRADPEVATDGVEDFLLLCGLHRVDWDELNLGEEMTIHLHADDAGADAEWTLAPAQQAYSRSHLKADVALRGSAWAIQRWCWRRVVSLDGGPHWSALGLEAFGDSAAAEAWRPQL